MTVRGNYCNGFAPRDFAPAYPSLWQGCVGAWAPCLGPTGLTLYDWSGLQNHGTLTSMDPPTDWDVHQGAYSLDFDGSNDNVNMSRPAPTNTEVTLAAWAYIASLPTLGFIIFNGNFGSDGNGFGIGNVAVSVAGSTFLGYQQGAGSTGGAFTVSTGWHHFATVNRGSTLAFYYDGLLVQSATPSAISVAASTRVRLGGNVYFFTGKIDDARVYNRALIPNEIALLASARGIAYQPARRRLYSGQGGNRRRRLLLGSAV